MPRSTNLQETLSTISDRATHNNLSTNHFSDHRSHHTESACNCECVAHFCLSVRLALAVLIARAVVKQAGAQKRAMAKMGARKRTSAKKGAAQPTKAAKPPMDEQPPKARKRARLPSSADGGPPAKRLKPMKCSKPMKPIEGDEADEMFAVHQTLAVPNPEKNAKSVKCSLLFFWSDF